LLSTLKPLLIFFILVIAGFGLHANDAISKTRFEQEHRGIRLVALSLPSPNPYDIDLLDPQTALSNIGGAIDKIYTASAFSADHIDLLKRNGKVTIIYDATFPKPDMASQVIAAYFPDYYQHDGKSREFRVVVGRFGAKWSTSELAAVIVHELVGHGLQHLRGKTQLDRKIDRECEALIYEEQAYQDFSYKRDTQEMVRFRKNMRETWCGDFSRYMSAQNINTDQAWGFGKPNVPKLLGLFERYTQHLRETGVSDRALKASRAEKQRQFSTYISAAQKRNDAEELFLIAERYLKGIGTRKDEMSARKWFLRAAKANHPRGQFYLGAMMESGIGGPQDMINAHMWYSIAAENGIDKAGTRKAMLTPMLSSIELSKAQELANFWRLERQQ